MMNHDISSVCFSFSAHGSCRWGTACRFLHAGWNSGSLVAWPPPQQQQGNRGLGGDHQGPPPSVSYQAAPPMPVDPHFSERCWSSSQVGGRAEMARWRKHHLRWGTSNGGTHAEFEEPIWGLYPKPQHPATLQAGPSASTPEAGGTLGFRIMSYNILVISVCCM